MRKTRLTVLVAAGCLMSGTAIGGVPQGTPKSCDWTATGSDAFAYNSFDLNADGFDDLVCLNKAGQIWAAINVNGWKSAGWNEVRPAGGDPVLDFFGPNESSKLGRSELALVFADRIEIVIGSEGKTQIRLTERLPDGARFVAGESGAKATGETEAWPANIVEMLPQRLGLGVTGPSTEPVLGTPPPYQTDAKVVARTLMDVNKDGVSDHVNVYHMTKVWNENMVRVTMSPNAASTDQDGDGLADEEEATIGTDPYNRDTDEDSFLDGWEVHGLPRNLDLGAFIKPYAKDAPEGEHDMMLKPLRQDVIVNVSYFDGVNPEQFRNEMPKVQAVYRKLNCTNPDGSRGVFVHFRELPGFVNKEDQKMPWWDVGNKYFPQHERGLMHWLQVTPWGGGQSSETGDMGGCGNNWMVFAHEFGHQMSLSHTGDCAPAWCPLYPSLMSYAFSYSFDGDGNKVHFSDGEFRDTVLEEKALVEKLPYKFESLKYLANHPYRFTLKDNGDGTTLIDWNQNGKFDEGPVEADINYGGSTYCGTRREQELTGSAPALAYVGDVCSLISVDQTRDNVWIKMYQGDEKWSDKRNIPGSATEQDPVLVGGKDFGLVFHHHLFGWNVTKFTATELGTPARIADLPAISMNACRVGDRILLVSRHDDDILEYRWLTFKDNDFSKPQVSAATKLEARSQVTPGLGVDPADGRVLIVTSYTNSRPQNFCMRVTWAVPKGEKLWEQEMKWTRGEGSGNGCCSRPVVAFTNTGQLNIFHQGWPDGNGQAIAYRTSRIGNDKLDEGWLTCKLYDEWTRSHVGVAFANGPQGAIYAYRWDAGGKNNNLQVAHNGFGIDSEPMRDFNDGEKISKWGIRRSIMSMVPEPAKVKSEGEK